MTNYLLFLLKSTLILSLLYLVFSLLMRKETFFRLNRMVLLLMVVSSLLIPLLYIPQPVQPMVQLNLKSIFQSSPIVEESVQTTEIPTAIKSSTLSKETIQPATISTITIVLFIYLSGVIVSLLILFYSIGSVLLLLRKARKTKHLGFQLMIVNDDIPAFSFGRYILISQRDYNTNPEAIIIHEQAHIRLGHFYDLLLMELVKIIYWFNPLVYRLIRDMKEIHEFQADDYTLTSGIDVTQYQILIIQKCVGPQRFALANSFNHCQIKKRITMMNKQKTSEARRWKVATFLPLLALLLMAFGKTGVNVPEKIMSPPEIVQIVQENQSQKSSRLIEIKKDGNYIDNKLCSLEEIVKKGKEWGKASNDWIHLRIDQSIPYNRIDEIREQLDAANVGFITQSTVNSDDTIYFMGDVSQSAKFTHGKFNDWMNSQLNNYPDIKFKKYKISYSFIVDKNGKARDGHVTKGSDYPEINEAYGKILTQIPDWEPAKRGSAKVSVYFNIMVSSVFYTPPKK